MGAEKAVKDAILRRRRRSNVRLAHGVDGVDGEWDVS